MHGAQQASASGKAKRPGKSVGHRTARPHQKKRPFTWSFSLDFGHAFRHLPSFQGAHLETWLKLMRREDFDLLAGAVRTEQIRRGSGSASAAANNSTCMMRQQAPTHVRLSNFPPEILSLIFSHVDMATLLGVVPNMCRDWRAACADDVHGTCTLPSSCSLSA